MTWDESASRTTCKVERSAWRPRCAGSRLAATISGHEHAGRATLSWLMPGAQEVLQLQAGKRSAALVRVEPKAHPLPAAKAQRRREALEVMRRSVPGRRHDYTSRRLPVP